MRSDIAGGYRPGNRLVLVCCRSPSDHVDRRYLSSRPSLSEANIAIANALEGLVGASANSDDECQQTIGPEPGDARASAWCWSLMQHQHRFADPRIMIGANRMSGRDMYLAGTASRSSLLPLT